MVVTLAIVCWIYDSYFTFIMTKGGSVGGENNYIYKNKKIK